LGEVIEKADAAEKTVEKIDDSFGEVTKKTDSAKTMAVGSVTEARRADPLPSPSWGSEARALEGMKQGGFPD
jgi:hypothetical protein